MKLLTIIYDSAIEESMTELLEALEVPGITLIEHVTGRGGRGPKMNNAIYPGTNHIALIYLPTEEVPKIRRTIRRLQDRYRLKPGVTILCQDVEVLD